MGHTHEHKDNTYYIEQLCTIGVCAALGIVGVMLWRSTTIKPGEPAGAGTGMIDLMLNPNFHLPVLLGGITLVILILVRALAVWSSVRQTAHHHDHEHEHEHDHDHTHDHEHGGAGCSEHEHEHSHEHEHAEAASHSHEHGHEHSAAFWRYAVLLLPVVLYFLNLPNKTFSAAYFGASMDVGDLGTETFAAPKASGDATEFGLTELKEGAPGADFRKEYQGKAGKLKGQFTPMNNRVFTLMKTKMNCCAADAIAVKSEVAIVAPQGGVGPIQDMEWIEVEGTIQFREKPDEPGAFMPILQVPSKDKIRKIPPQPF